MPKSACQCVNPNYLKCLEEWREEIKAKNPGNKLISVVGKAIASLKTYPHVINTPRECRPLPYFGDWIIRNLTERLDSSEGRGGVLLAPKRSRKEASLDVPLPNEVSASTAKVSRDPSRKTAERRRRASSLNPTDTIVKIPRAVPRRGAAAVNLGWDPYTAEIVRDAPQTGAASVPSSFRTSNRLNPSVSSSRTSALRPAAPTDKVTANPSPTIPSAAALKTAHLELGQTSNTPIMAMACEAGAPVFLRASKKAQNQQRLPSHVPPPTAIDQQLERFLDKGTGSNVANIDDDEPGAVFELPFTSIVYPSNSYDIIFILDSREVKSTKHREYIQEALIRSAVPVERRALELGDMFWIARHRETKQEIALDFIIERKRLDDLVNSIKDGRFHEQKFRLKQSGISRIYYLVEEYAADCVHHSMDKAVFTALSSTQIIDGFFLKETRDIDDTIEYLVGLHHAIVARYHGQELRVIPDNIVKRHSHIALITQLQNAYPDVTYHTTYAAFRELNKAGAFTLRDVFARTLLCIRGMSAEKVANVLEHYDTPRKLWEAFRNAEEVEARERELELIQLENESKRGRRKKSQVVPARQMLTRLSANGRRQIKAALAEQVYDLFMSEEY